MIFIYLRKEGKISASPPTTLGTVVLFYHPKEVSLESIFQVALLSHIFSSRRRGGQIQVFNTKFPLAAIFNHQKLGTSGLYLTSL